MTIRLGRVAGIPIGANWTVLVIAWLICWSVATAALPDGYPDYGDGQYWAAGIAVAVLFFASLTGHELAHSLIAQRAGVTVTDITLWMLGGVSRFSDDADDARDELRIAVAGPVASFVFAAGFLFMAAAMSAAGLPELAVAVPALLVVLNVMLGAFNLLPAFPLDGGRVLRALLWKRWDDRLRATRAAAAIGRASGVGLVGLGIFLMTASVALDGIWLGFIGLFIVFASTVEAAEVENRELLAGVTVGDIMTRDPHTVPPDVSVEALLHDYVLRWHTSAYPVVGPDGVEGLVTLAQIRAVAADARRSTPVRAVARPVSDVVVAAPGDRVVGLLPRLASSPDRRALVVEGGTLVGIVSHTDLTRALEIRSMTAERSPSAG